MEHLEEEEDDHKDVMESLQSGSNSGLGGPMEATWARMAEEEEVSFKRRRKMLKGFDELLRNSVKVEEEVLENLRVNTKCSRQTRGAVVAPLREFIEELRGRWSELGGEVWMKSVMNVMRALKVENADDLETSFLELRNVDESSMWAKEKESLKRTVRDHSKNAEKWRCRVEDAEKAIKVAKRGQMFEENDEESAEESEASEDYLSMRERFRRRSSRQDMRTDSARRPSGQEARQEKKKSSGASKWDKNSARLDEKVAKWPNGAWWERGDRKTRCSEQRGEKISDCRSSRSQKSTAETVKEVVASMNKMMRVAALPEPKAFDGSGSFREFKRTFLMKFRDVVEDDEGLMYILEDKFLLGSAKSLFRSLESRRNRPIKILFDEFEEKLKRRQGDSQTHALAVFEELSRGAGQKMWEYFGEVEKWSRKEYPEADRMTNSQMRVIKLMKAAKDDRGLHNLLIMKRSFQLAVPSLSCRSLLLPRTLSTA
uniref:Uncharacterized protein n=1 Tax=Caenorhabditis japonica TaxID=281687 RepID=A0A8R1ISH7_CAEJA